MEILPLEYANSTLAESCVFLGGDENKRYEISFKVYLIREGEKLILADAGCETMPGFDMENFIGPIKALEKVGISPCDITDVVITHSHHDHIECVKYFPDALIHIEKGEYESGREYIPAGFKTNVFSDEYAISENVKIIKIGGHSKGSCIVEAKTPDKTYIISGDECYSRECLERNIPTGSCVDLEKSRYFIEEYSKDKYTVLLCHND